MLDYNVPLIFCMIRMRELLGILLPKNIIESLPNVILLYR